MGSLRWTLTRAKQACLASHKTTDDTNMDMEVAVFLVIFLLTSSVATVAICCLELKAVWISYKDTKTIDSKREPECTCRPTTETKPTLSPVSLPKGSPASTPGKYTRKEGLTVPRAASLAISPTYSGNNSNSMSMRESHRQYSLREPREQPGLTMNMNWTNGDAGHLYSRHPDNGLELNAVGDGYRSLARHPGKAVGPVPI